MRSISEQLAEGDLRTIGNVDSVIKQVLAHKSDLKLLVDALHHEDSGVRMRAADALEKISGIDTSLVQPYKPEFFSVLKESVQQEVQWHLAQIIPRLTLSQGEAKEAYNQLLRFYQESDSSIVKLFSLQAMVDISHLISEKKADVIKLARHALKTGTPAMKNRAKKLLHNLNQT